MSTELRLGFGTGKLANSGKGIGIGQLHEIAKTGVCLRVLGLFFESLDKVRAGDF
jgi:hypothetical protein